MAARTGRGVDFTPSFRISELRGIRRNAHTLHGGGTRPRCQEPLHQRVDLLVGQRPARADGEGGLRRARYALGNDLAEALLSSIEFACFNVGKCGGRKGYSR